MKGKVQILIAIALSMLLTFVLDCSLQHTSAHNSLTQQFVDISHDFNLIIRCWYDDRHSNK
jgi:hypothetical protein